MALKALLFDVDGTLADTEPHGHLPAYNAAFEEAGLEWHWTPELYRELLWQPGGRERLRYYIQHHKPKFGVHRDRAREDTDGWVSDIHAIKTRHFRKRIKSGMVPLRPGVVRLMKEATADGIRVAIVTNASKRSLEPFLEHMLGKEMLSQVTEVVSGEQVLRKKPAPDLYLEALRRLKLAAPECLAIEDSEMGLRAARDAGIATLITLNEDTRDHDFSEACMVVDQLGECRKPINFIKGEANGEVCVTLPMLRKLLAAEFPERRKSAQAPHRTA